MSDDRDLLERALRRFEPDPGLVERVMRRRDRKRRNQRIRAGVLGVAITVAGIVVLGNVVGTDRVPMDTLTPTPPASAAGDLVLSLDTTVSAGDPYKTTLYVYADGRMIWERHAAATGVPEGAKWNSTGYLEQVLTPEGIEALRSEALDSGLFEDDLHLKGGWENNGDIYGTRISVLGDDGKTVSLAWAAGYDDDRQPTPAELDTIRGLVDRLKDPGAWLSETAWEDRQIRANVASSYGVSFSLVTKPDGECCLRPDPSELPAPADQILGTQLNQCITTDEARAIIEGFEAAGMTPVGESNPPGGLEYETGTEPDAYGMTQSMVLFPVLPDWSC